MRPASETQTTTTRHSDTTRRLPIVALTAAALLLVALTACGGEVPDDDPAQRTDVGEGGKHDDPGPGGDGAPLPADSLVYACIRSTACGVKPYPRVSNCVAYYSDMLTPLGQAPLYDTIYSCANRAASCSALKQCFGVADGCSAGYQATCQDGKAVFCDLLDKTTFTHDCKAAGMTCQLDPQYGFAATCVPSGGAAPAAPAQGAMKSTVDCADGRCVRTGQACSADELNRCSGDRLEACLDGEWIRFDCGQLDLGGCQTRPGGWASCGETP